MGKNSAIEWTDHTWNPWRGCHKISAGCKNCYMFREQKRYGRDPSIVVRAADGTFYAPLRWKEPAFVFTCSWSDFFIEDADAWRVDAWDVIRRTPHLTYLVLTKRLENVPSRVPYDWPLDNVWLGVSIEDQDTADERIPQLPQIPAAVRFVSAEPLLGKLNLSYYLNGCPEPYGGGVEYVTHDMAMDACMPEIEGMAIEQEPQWAQTTPSLDWLIVGGESGPNARPCHPDWVRSLRDQCVSAGIPFFFKQWGEWSSDAVALLWSGIDKPPSNVKLLDGEWMAKIGKKAAGRLLDGREWNERP